MNKCPDFPVNFLSQGAALQTDAIIVLCTDQAALAPTFEGLTVDLARVVVIEPSVSRLRQTLESQQASLVVFDFADMQSGSREAWFELVELARQSNVGRKQLLCVAVGRMSRPEGAVMALRAGVSDFLDLDDVSAFRATLSRLLNLSAQSPKSARKAHCRSVLLLSPRPGVGCSTLAANLACTLQHEIRQFSGRAAPGQTLAPDMLPLDERMTLLDLGWPGGDGALYLGAGQAFDFVQASNQRHRLDETMLHAALEQHGSGLNVLSLPADARALSQLQMEDALGLIQYLHSRFAGVVIDGGGHPGPRLMADLEGQADEVWVVVNQGMGTLVSLSELLEVRQDMGLEGKLSLIVNQFDERCGLSAEAIAERFKLPLRAVLPERRVEHMASASRGRLLMQEAKHDPYVKEVARLAGLLMPPEVARNTRHSMWQALQVKFKK